LAVLALTPLILPAQVRDSAGIQIIQSTSARLTGSSAWRLSAAATIDIGAGDPDGPYDLRDGRAGPLNVIELPNGRIVIANGATGAVRYYDQNGRFLREFGRAGEGPGEFRQMALRLGRGDTVVVIDPVLRRLTKLDGDGKLVSEIRIPWGYGTNTGHGAVLLEPLGIAGDGTLVVVASPIPVASRRTAIGPYRDSLYFYRSRSETALVELLSVNGLEMHQAAKAPSGTPLAYGRQTYAALQASRILIAQNDAWQVEEYGVDGRLHRVFRHTVTPIPITARRAEQLTSDALERYAANPRMSASARASAAANAQSAEYASHFPLITGIFAASDGYVYVQESGDPDALRSLAVIGPDGVLVTRIVLPPNFRVMTVGKQKVFGLVADEDGFMHVLGYTIVRR
jgi:hypothetical protein